MNLTLTKTQIQATELLQQITQTLYEDRPGVYLLHADLTIEEKTQDSVTECMIYTGKFSVAVTEAIKVELAFTARYSKSTDQHMTKRFRTWRLDKCHVTEPNSGDILHLQMHEGKPVVWNSEGERGEFLKLILAN